MMIAFIHRPGASFVGALHTLAIVIPQDARTVPDQVRQRDVLGFGADKTRSAISHAARCCS
jgi:hypothetical protein